MGLTHLRHQGAPAPAPPPVRAAKEPAASPAHPSLDLRRLRRWFERFAALHHLTVVAVDSQGETVAGPFNESAFCALAKSHPPEACPGDCGQSAAGHASTWRCPYQLTCGAVPAQGPGGKPVRLIVGRTLACQEDLTACQDAVAVMPAWGDDALAALAGVPWRSAEQLGPVLEFVSLSLDLLAGGTPPEAEKPKDLRHLRRNVS